MDNLKYVADYRRFKTREKFGTDTVIARGPLHHEVVF